MEYSISKYLNLLEKRHADEALKYRASFVPDYLYKFFWLSDDPDEEGNKMRLYTLSSNQLWFAGASAQNDPYEFQGMYIDEDELISYGFSTTAAESVKDKLLNSQLIAAFTGNMSDNLPMWAHYANNHHGFAVKYKVHRKEAFRNVTYEKDRIPISKIICTFFNASVKFEKEPSPNNQKELELYSTIMQEAFFLKHSSWGYEKEFRSLYPAKPGKKGMNVPLSEIGLTTEEIYCGKNCSQANKDTLFKIAEGLNVPCKVCRISDAAFTIAD